DWAIRLFIDHQAYLPAITLAGAAEQIPGKLVRTSAHTTLKQSLASDHGMTEKEISDDALNRVKNWLKHGSESPAEKMVIEDDEVVQMVARALASLVALDRSCSGEGPRLLKWLEKNKPGRLENCPELTSIVRAQ
ncbi:MAG: hypothetical protein N2444_08935, partial [Methylocystis sp.]|nr:hypothetical protein [Methylocystis sp.]